MAEQLIDRAESSVVLINTGDNLSYQDAENTEKARMILSSLSILNPACIAVGMGELELGKDGLQSLGEYSAPIVCSNQNWGLSSVLPYVVQTIGGKKMLIAAVIDPDLLQTPINKGLAEHFPLGVPQEALVKLRDSIDHDIFIVVAHAKEDKARQWVEEVSGIDILAMGFDLKKPSCSTMKADTADNHSQTIFMANRSRGATISYADINFYSPGISLNDSGFVTVSQKEPEDERTLLKWRDYEYAQRRKLLKRGDDPYFSSVGNSFDYLEYLKQRKQGIKK